MKLQLYILLCIPMVCLGIECSLKGKNFFCDGMDKYNFIYHFYKSRPVEQNYEIEIINSDYPTLEELVNPRLENGFAIITKLTIKNSSIEVVKKDAFKSLYELETLDLSRNKISYLDFDIPSSVRYLNLSHNFLKVIDFKILNTHMGFIDFSYNFINALKNSYYPTNYAITSANFSNNEIMKFDNGRLNCKFKSINLENNFLNDIDVRNNIDSNNNYFLEELRFTSTRILSYKGISNTYLKKLIISNSYIQVLEADSFLGMFNLQELQFPNTTVHSVSSRAFNGLFSLKYLDCQGLFKHSRTLKNETFFSLNSLRRLDLSNLYLQDLEPDAFSDLKTLESLLLNNNSISHLKLGLFRDLASLTYLDLSHNKISICPSESFRGLKTLNKLYLNNNNISMLTGGSFSGLKGLVELHLENNQIEWLPKKVFSHLNNLRALYLNDNVVSKVYAFHLAGVDNLAKLYLQNNRIVAVEFFQELQSLEELRLDNNDLKSIEQAAFINLNHPVSLNVSNNKIQNYDFAYGLPLLTLFK